MVSEICTPKPFCCGMVSEICTPKPLDVLIMRKPFCCGMVSDGCTPKLLDVLNSFYVNCDKLNHNYSTCFSM